jgi:hypothetical protein
MFPLLLGLIFVVIGTYLVLRSRRLGKSFKASLNWPSTPGRIVSNEIIVRSGYTETGQTPVVRYTPSVIYEYNVGGSSLTGSTIRSAKPTVLSRETAQGILAPYGSGAPVSVFYDPQAPTNSMLERTKPKGRIFITLVGVIFAGLGALITLGGVAILFEHK